MVLFIRLTYNFSSRNDTVKSSVPFAKKRENEEFYAERRSSHFLQHFCCFFESRCGFDFIRFELARANGQKRALGAPTNTIHRFADIG